MEATAVRKTLPFVCLLASSFCLGAAYAGTDRATTHIVKEEQLVRFAYSKLRWYLAREHEANGAKGLPPKIELHNMRVGDLAEIVNAPASEYVSFPVAGAEAPIIRHLSVNGDDGKGERHFGFTLRWQVEPNQQRRIQEGYYGGFKTVKDVVGSGPAHGLAWSSYAAYEVRYVDEGHDETHRALSVFGPIKEGEQRAFREVNLVTMSGVQNAATEERPALPRHYWRTGTLRRQDGAFGMVGMGGRGDTPGCELQNSPTACYGRVCCDDAAGAAECCWRAMPTAGEVAK